MKRTATDKPTLSVCVAVRNCDKFLEACLASVRERVPQAEICIVDTMSSDGTVDIALRFADRFLQWSGPAGTWTKEMYAVDDMAAARNKTFELATGDWVMWIDADDVLPGPVEAQRLLELNGHWKPGKASEEPPAEPEGLDEFLLRVGKLHPELCGFWCPYLYRSMDEEGRAHTWQIRERIVRNDGSWTWRRKAHEVLVPHDPKLLQRMSHLSHLLFVHKKLFTPDDNLFSLRRHHAIMAADYARGVRNVQDMLYLENYSHFLEPDRRKEYIDSALAVCNTANERARVLIRRAQYSTDNGFYLEAVEAVCAAIALDPEFPDSYATAGDVYAKAERWSEAAQALERSAEVPVGHPFSALTPRDQTLANRLRAAEFYFRASRAALVGSDIEQARKAMQAAVRCTELVMHSPMVIGEDRAEASMRHFAMVNELNALIVAEEIRDVWQYLRRNDENVKARQCLDIIPHNLQDHPVAQALHQWARKLTAHLEGGKDYAKFYEEEPPSRSYAPPPLDKVEVQLGRVGFLIGHAKVAFGDKPIEVLEVGSWDGITALPFMKYMPNAKYTALEANSKALAQLTSCVKEYGWLDRFTGIRGLDEDMSIVLPPDKKYDVVVLFEVIEHVPDPALTLERLRHFMKSDGLLFVSTPHGAFDRGEQPDKENRDCRGHVRAMMPRDLVETLRSAGLEPLELDTSHSKDGNYGDTMVTMSAKGNGKAMRGVRATLHANGTQRPLFAPSATFAVAGALWDWNATTVIRDGIGASEETIVYLARDLALEGAKEVEVYGPLPKSGVLVDAEVNAGVAYWPREQFRHINPENPVVVSRSPTLGGILDHETGCELDKVLWLQDAYYPDLNAKVADTYRDIIVLSEWHKQTLARICGVPEKKFTVIPNFLLGEHFNHQRLATLQREPHRFIYASSPDRGLVRLLKLWPDVVKLWPDATLHIYYGWEGCMRLGGRADPSWTERYRGVRLEYLKHCRQPGIVEHGRVNHDELAKAMYASTAWLYPTDFDETFCSTAIKARAAGCIPVVTPRAALNESAACGWTRWVRDEDDAVNFRARFLGCVAQAIDVTANERASMAKQAIDQYRLEAIRPAWHKVLA